MIDIKILSKSRSASGGGSVSGGSYAGVAVEAEHAATADKAKKADLAEMANYATKAGQAARADYATKAGDLDEDAEILKRYLRKDIDDTAKGVISFMAGLGLGGPDAGSGHWKPDGEGRSHLVTDYLEARKDTVLHDVVVDRIHDPKSTPAERTIIGAQGLDIYMGKDGKAHMYIDYLAVRNKFFASSAEVRKVSYSGGTSIFSNAGSTIAKVVYIFDDAGKNVIAYKCYCVADDGTTATSNWWRVGMMALCQTFNVKTGIYNNVSNRYYWRLCVGAGQETLEDGKLYDYVILSNVREFGGGDNILPSYVLRILADEADNYLSWGGVLVGINARENNTSLANLLMRQDGKAVDDNNTPIADRMFYGYEPVAGGEPDIPTAGDVIVNVGDQVSWNSRGNVIKLSTSTEDNSTDNAPSLTMYHGVGAPYRVNGVVNVWQWKRITAILSPEEIRLNTKYFKLYSGDDPYDESDPWKDTENAAREYTDTQIEKTQEGIDIFARKFNFDSKGNLKNYDKSGLATEGNFAELYSQKVDPDDNVKTFASIKTSIVTTDGAKGTTSIGQVEINGDKVKINADHKLNIDGDYIVIKTKNFSVDEAGNVTVTGTISATHGKVAGFTIDGNNLSNTPFDNDASVIFRNDTYDTFAGIGGNVLPASSGLRAVARFENHDTRNQWGFGKNIAMIASAKNSDYNYAMLATGNVVVNNGYVSSYTLNKFTISQDGIIFSDGTPVKKGNVWLVNSTANNAGISLPTLDEIRLHLGISNATPFALKYSVVADFNANSFRIYGRNQKQDTKGGTPWNVAKLPNIIYHDGQHLDEIWMEMGDSVMFLLVYDPDNGSKDGYDCKYTARVINRQFE